MNKKIFYVLGVVVILVAVALVAARYLGGAAPVAPQSGTPAAQAPAPAPSIVKAVMSRSIDAKGNATGETTTFNAKTDKIVYAVLTLANTPKGTKLSYIRYLGGKYVDSKVVVTARDNAAIFDFSFEKGIGNYPTGTYMLKLYVNGKYSTSLTYAFK